MSTSFASRRSAGTNSLTKLLGDLKKSEGKKSFKDDRIWRLETDKAGNGRATIRFIPDPEGEFYVQKWSHSVQGPGGFYIENCLTTLGNQCPCCEVNNQLWNTGVEENKNIARNRKRKLQYVSNILVIKDPAKPENEGKVFLYEYGAKIMNMIKRLAEPEFAEESPINPFHEIDGANFQLVATKQAGFRNYDTSKFMAPTPILGGDDAKIDALMATTHVIKPLIAPDQFKSHEALKARLEEVLGGKRSSSPATAAPALTQTKRTPAAPVPAAVADEDDEVDTAVDDEDDPSKYFASLAD